MGHYQTEMSAWFLHHFCLSIASFALSSCCTAHQCSGQEVPSIQIVRIEPCSHARLTLRLCGFEASRRHDPLSDHVHGRLKNRFARLRSHWFSSCAQSSDLEVSKTNLRGWSRWIPQYHQYVSGLGKGAWQRWILSLSQCQRFEDYSPDTDKWCNHLSLVPR